MKVVDGKFGKKGEKEMTLYEKIALAMNAVLDEEELGSFLLITDTGDGTLGVVSDMPTEEAVYIAEVAKLNLIMNTNTGGTLH